MMKIIISVFIVVLWISCPSFVLSKTVEENSIRKVVKVWLEENGVFQKASKVLSPGQKFSIESIKPIAWDDTGDVLSYHIDLTPQGYLVVSGNDLLNPVICYSAYADLDISDHSDNSLRAILMRDFDSFKKSLREYRKGNKSLKKDRQYKENQKQWNTFVSKAENYDTVGSSLNYSAVYLESQDTSSVIGPFLNTTWNQNRHYNDLCPDDPAASEYYYDRMPVGCVAVAAGQVMKHYNWPPHGTGFHAYDWDSSTLSADFSDSYDWELMLDAYDPWNEEPDAAVASVAELLYEIGVSVEMYYDHYGSISSVTGMNSALNRHFFYEFGERIERHDDISAFGDAITLEMNRGRPTVITIPGHAVVADGLDTSMNEPYYHINYGWGGTNDGWYFMNDVNGNSVDNAVIGTIPSFLPLMNPNPQGIPDTDGSFSLSWDFPVNRVAEVESFTLWEGQYQSGLLLDQANEYDLWRVNGLWQIVSPGYDSTGNAFYLETKTIGDFSLSLIDNIIPNNSATLHFNFKAILVAQTFSVEVSEDDGQSWITLFQVTNQRPTNWEQEEIDLSNYSGSSIKLRFRLVYPAGGSYWIDGGLWLDDIVLSDSELLTWQTVTSEIEPSQNSYEINGKGTGIYYYSLQACSSESCGDRSPAVYQQVDKPNISLTPIFMLLLKKE